jgi:hypothetical protein
MGVETYVQDDRGALGSARPGSGAHLHGHRGVLLGHFFADLVNIKLVTLPLREDGGDVPAARAPDWQRRGWR